MLDFASSSDVGDIGESVTPVSDTEILDAYSNAVTSVADAVGPAVVRVEIRNDKGRPGGVGSGVIIAPDGLVLTNSHVVEGAKEVRVQDAEGRVMDARALGIDPEMKFDSPDGRPLRLVDNGKPPRELVAGLL